MSKQYSQRDAVYAAIVSVCGESDGTYSLTTEQRSQIRLILFEGFKGGSVVLSEDAAAKGETWLWNYIPGLISNHLRKDKRLNGDVKYEAKNPGSRTGSSDPELKNLMALYGTLVDETEKAEVMDYITARKAELTKAKAPTIDFSKLPEELRAKFTK